MHSPTDTRQEGFTMVEILVSLLLLTIVMAGTLSLQLAAMRASHESRAVSTAMMLGQRSMERFRAERCDTTSCPVPTTAIECFDRAGQGAVCGSTGVVYTSTTVYAATANGVRADVTVQWDSREGAQQLALSTERWP